MPSNENSCKVNGTEKFGGTMRFRPDGGGMGKDERLRQVLTLLDESDLALTPYVLFRNLKMRGATFERRTLSNYLSELIDDGYVEKVKSTGDPLYQITENGREYLRN